MTNGQERNWVGEAGWACHIYREAMRSFLSRELRRIQGFTIEEAIRQALRGRLRDEFENNVKKVSQPIYAISYSDFPHLLWHYRSRIFGGYFRDNRDSIKRAYGVRDFRNQELEHGDTSTLSLERTAEVMETIAEFLAEINEVAARDQLLARREELLNPTTNVGAYDVALPGDQEAEPAQSNSSSGLKDEQDSSTEDTRAEQVTELLEPGTYDMNLKLIYVGDSSRGTPRFGLLFEKPDTGQPVWRNFYLTERAIPYLDWFMSDFQLDTSYLDRILSDESARSRTHAQLLRLTGRAFRLEIIKNEYEGKERNEVRSWVPEDVVPREEYSSPDDLPF